MQRTAATRNTMALLSSYEWSFPDLSDREELTPEVKSMVKVADWQTFIVAMTVLVGGGYALIFAPSASGDTKLAIAGFIGAVITYFFGRQISTTTAASTIAATQSGSNNSNTASAQGAAQQGSKP